MPEKLGYDGTEVHTRASPKFFLSMCFVIIVILFVLADKNRNQKCQLLPCASEHYECDVE